MKHVILFLLLGSIAAHADEVQVINSGTAGFQKRFEMIDHAQTFIDVEYFIYSADEAGRLFTQALLKKKKDHPQIQIRILLDASPLVLEMGDNYVSALAKAGIEVRYYNPAPLAEILKTQYRDHRKLIVVDSPQGLEAITGSRNIADEYFDMNPRFNFRDRDLWIRGLVATQMKDSFEAYWANDRVFKAPLMPDEMKLEDFAPNKNKEATFKKEDENYHKKVSEALSFITEDEHDREIRREVERLGNEELADTSSQGVCTNLQYVTDEPGFDEGHNIVSNKRKVLRSLIARIEQIPENGELIMESPYFIVNDLGPMQTMHGLQDKNIHSVLLTNGLASTDAFYVAANFIPAAGFYHSMSNGKFYMYSGQEPKNLSWTKNAELDKPSNKTIWGIHAKTYVFSDDSFAIGTFNLDPRSANLNAEMLVYCEGNSALSKYVTDDIYERIAQSSLLNKTGTAADKKDVLSGATLLQRLEYVISIAPVRILAPLL
jgi:putative cardiolipin synthase